MPQQTSTVQTGRKETGVGDVLGALTQLGSAAFMGMG